MKRAVFSFFKIFLFFLFCQTSAPEKILKTEKMKTINKKDYYNNSLTYSYFTIYLPSSWRFKANDIMTLFKKNENKNDEKLISLGLETRNSLAFGTLNVYKNPYKQKILTVGMRELIKKKFIQRSPIQIINSIWEGQEGDSILMKGLINTSKYYKNLSNEIYFGIYFSEKYIYEIFLLSSINFDKTLFEKEAKSILNQFLVRSDLKKEIKEAIWQSQGVRIPYKKYWKYNNLEERQILNFQHLNYPLYFDLEFLGQVRSLKSYKERVSLDAYQFFNKISSFSQDYEFFQKETDGGIFKPASFIDKKFKMIIYYVFGLDSSIRLKSQSKIQIYYFVNKNKAYRASIWYNQYHVDYEKEIKDILSSLDF